jgi:hypothetical protein
LTRHVAIKVLAPQLVHSVSARRRFAREGRATAALSHDNVVTVHAVEDKGPRPYLVMEYVPGLSLQQRLDRSGALPLAEAVRIGAQVAAGLAAAHAHGLVHRDVKPGNVLLESGTGRVKLTDFGLVQEEDGAVSQVDVLAGTPLYMSPEQARGERVDQRCDLFSLGSVLYALCAGRPPFSGSTPLAVLRQISEANPPPLRRLNPAVPGWLADLIARLHAKEPAARPGAAEVAGILLERASDPALARRPRRLLRALAVLAGLAVVGLAVGEAGGLTDLRNLTGPWLRGEATLIVHNDDPQAILRVAGQEGELTGEGWREWTLPAGDYLLLTQWPGQGRHEEPIHLGRGGWRKIHLKGSQHQAGEGPFVVLPRRGGPERACASLSAAIAEAGPGDTIEVRSNGPFVLPPVRLFRPLVIRAGEGFRPVLRHDDREVERGLLETDQPLALEGLELEVTGTPSFREGYTRLVHSWGPALAIANCRLQVRRAGSCVLFTGARLEVRRSLLLRGVQNHGSINWEMAPGSAVRLDDSVFAGGHMSFTLKLPSGGPAASLRIRHSTLVAQNPFAILQGLRQLAKKPPARPLLDIELADSVLASTGEVFHWEQAPWLNRDQPGWPQQLPFATVAPLLPRLVAYRDRGSLYPVSRNLLGFTSEWKPLPGARAWTTLKEWYSFWGQSQPSDAVQGRIAFQGGDVAERLGKDVRAVHAADFRLPADSPGKGTARDGRDFGADVDLVGPANYQRWRQTADYRDWQRRVDQLMSGKKEAR